MMDQLNKFRQLNLWDFPVLELKLVNNFGGGFDVEVQLQASKSLPSGASADVAARLLFKKCHEFLASIDVALWSKLGPEIGDQVASETLADPRRVRYVLPLRDPGSVVEIVAESFEYEGPDELWIDGDLEREKQARLPRVRDIIP
jgi:hypothetical protein